ncbi:MAG: hypothetical protein M3Z04_18660 [Chloroflexota bacterium]|nr:hypothetical protein [Chloroflexota bacterium]
MLFNSIYYGFFLPCIVALYWIVPRRVRYPLLLVASYAFYANWIPPYLLLILALTGVNYGFGLWLGRDRRRAVLALAVVTNLAVLGYFKYANFFLDAGRGALKADWPTLNILLPLGISFFTFEFIHYVVDVWRGSPPVRNFVQFALFAAFFPTQIAGPIKRYQAFVHQLQEHPRFDAQLAGDGVYLILRGLFKKVILADGLARIANLGFNTPADLNSVDTWIAVYAFAFQIFFDFSGYTDIGRGSAQLFGFTVPENFAAPYLARNLSDFWRRWHISLSSWLRDYLFIPLGGSRGSRLFNYRNLFLTMTLGGLWHGAAGHFLLWGAYQGAGLVALRWMGEVRRDRLGTDLTPLPPSLRRKGEPAAGDDLTPSPPSLQRKGEPAAGDDLTPPPPSLQRKGELVAGDLPSPFRGGVGGGVGGGEILVTADPLPAATDPVEPGDPPRPTVPAPWRAIAAIRNPQSAIGWLFGIVATFHFTCLGWVLFRAPDLATTQVFLTRLLTPVTTAGVFPATDRWTVLGIMTAYFVGVGATHRLRGVLPPARWERLVAWEWAMRPLTYAVLIVWMILFPAAAQRFLYFQF